jgi:hypothetical protein
MSGTLYLEGTRTGRVEEDKEREVRGGRNLCSGNIKISYLQLGERNRQQIKYTRGFRQL